MKHLLLIPILALIFTSFLNAEPPTPVGGSDMVKDIQAAAKNSKLPPGEIRAFQVKGTVNIVDIEDNVIERLKRGQTIQQGTIVKSEENSGALLMLSNGATINLGPNTKLEVAVFLQEPFDKSKGRFAMLKEDPSTSKLHAFLHHGEVLGNVKKLASASTFAVETPVGTAGVRGTTFFVSFGINETSGNYTMRISNLDGDVVVESPLEAQVVMSDGSIAAGKYNPYSGPKLYEVPKESVIVIEADLSLNLGNPAKMPRYGNATSFKAFTRSPGFQTMLGELNTFLGGNIGGTVLLFSPEGMTGPTDRSVGGTQTPRVEPDIPISP